MAVSGEGTFVCKCCMTAKFRVERVHDDIAFCKPCSDYFTEEEMRDDNIDHSDVIEERVNARVDVKRKVRIKKKATLQEQELARRVLARKRLLPFVYRFNKEYQAGWVHKDICLRLEQFAQDVLDKKSPRLMITCPPRTGKSILASTMFPAWFLGNNPDKEMIICSYSASLSMTFSRAIREVLRDERYQNVFKDTILHKDSQSVENWQTTKRGGLLAAGVGGPITGRGAHCLIIDDPVKNYEEAASATNRESVWNWWSSTAYTRLAPGGGVLGIMTKWHHDDLFGRIINQSKEAQKQGFDVIDWEEVKYPAIAEEDEEYRKAGEALHPERYDLKQLMSIKATITPRDWAALYQQSPTLDEGAYFDRQFFRYYGEGEEHQRPKLLNIYQTWDLALGQKEQHDYTVGMTFGVDTNDDIYILDIKRGRWNAMDIVEYIIDSYEQWKPITVGIERTHMQMAIEPFLNKRIRERKVYELSVYEMLPGRRDKELRARSIQGRMVQGKVYFPRLAPWLGVFETELLQFPAGANDDVVDVFAYAGLLLDDLLAPRIAQPEKPPSWKDKLSNFVKSGDFSKKSAMSA